MYKLDLISRSLISPLFVKVSTHIMQCRCSINHVFFPNIFRYKWKRGLGFRYDDPGDEKFYAGRREGFESHVDSVEEGDHILLSFLLVKAQFLIEEIVHEYENLGVDFARHQSLAPPRPRILRLHLLIITLGVRAVVSFISVPHRVRDRGHAAILVASGDVGLGSAALQRCYDSVIVQHAGYLISSRCIFFVNDNRSPADGIFVQINLLKMKIQLQCCYTQLNAENALHCI